MAQPTPARIRASTMCARDLRARLRRRRIRAATRRRSSQRKLLQKAQIVFVEETDIVDAVLQQRDALDADSERKSRIALRVVADCFEDRRVHHAAPKDLEPSGL